MSYLSPEEMVSSSSFLERLNGASEMPDSREFNDFSFIESIKNNVTHILNTRIGDSQSSPELGLIDFNDATLEARDLSYFVQKAIQCCLETYEPRLTNVVVSTDADWSQPYNLCFSVSAMTTHDEINEKLHFGLMLENNKRYRIL